MLDITKYISQLKYTKMHLKDKRQCRKINLKIKFHIAKLNTAFIFSITDTTYDTF